MTDVQLLTFITVYECNSFSKAAQKLYVPQSTISHRIEQLERQLNVSLFKRSARSLSLTPAGDIFLPHAKSILSSIENSTAALQNLYRKEESFLRIGSSNYLIQYLLRDRLTYFMRSYKNARFSIVSGSSDSILDQLDNRKIDIAITNYCSTNPEITFAPLLADDIVLLASSSWSGKNISIKALSDTLILMYPSERMFHTFLVQQLMQRGVILNNVAAVENIDLIKEMVISGMGLAFLPKLYIEDMLESGKAKIIQTPEMETISRTTYVGYNKNTCTPFQMRFINDLIASVVPC